MAKSPFGGMKMPKAPSGIKSPKMPSVGMKTPATKAPKQGGMKMPKTPKAPKGMC